MLGFRPAPRAPVYKSPCVPRVCPLPPKSLPKEAIDAIRSQDLAFELDRTRVSQRDQASAQLIARLEYERNVLQSQVDKLLSEVQGLRSLGQEIASREDQVHSDRLLIKREKEEVQREINTLATQLQQSLHVKDFTELKLAEVSQRCQSFSAALEERSRQLSSRIDSLLVQNEAIRSLLLQNEKKTHMLVENYEAALNRLRADSSRQIEELRGERDRLGGELKGASCRIADLERRLTLTQPYVDEANRLRLEYAATTSEKDTLARELTTLRLDNQALLTNLERLADMSHNEGSKSFSQIEKLSSDNQNLLKEVHAFKLRAEILTSEVEQLRKLVMECDRLVLENQRMKLDAARQIEGLNGQAQVLLSDNARLQGENQRLLSDGIRLKNDYELLFSRVEAIKKGENKTIFSEAIANRDKILALLTGDNREPVEEKARPDSDKFRGEAERTRSQLQRTKSQLQRVKAQLERMRGDNDKLKFEVDRLRTDLDRSKAEEERVSGQLSYANAELEKAKRELQGQREKISELERSRAELQRLKREMERLTAQLERVRSEGRAESDRAKAELQRLRIQNRRLLSKMEEDQRKRVEWMKEFQSWRKQVEGIESKESIFVYK